jgi:hypothetical protein
MGKHAGPDNWQSWLADDMHYAVALGRSETASYQRLKAAHSAGRGIWKARVAKSTVTSVVMSAAEKRSPATNSASPQRRSSHPPSRL